MNYDSKTELKLFLAQHKISLKKRFGQNFLINRNHRERLINFLEIRKSDIIWEIGPGLGALTELLVPKAGLVVAFEIDYGLAKALHMLFASADNFKLIEGDVLKTMPEAVKTLPSPSLIVGNLPYSCASQIIASLAESEIKPRALLFTIQTELAQRMTARPKEKNYSAFSLLCQASFKIEHKLKLAPTNFFPTPDVMSSVVLLKPERKFKNKEEFKRFQQIVRLAFSSRRKTLGNTLFKKANLSIDEKEKLLACLASQHLSLTSRPEELSLDVWINLARLLR